MRDREATDELFVVPSDTIRIDEQSHDNMPVLLRGLQHLYVNERLREEPFELLERQLAIDCDHDNGRPGMKLWQILVLAVVKQVLDCHYDRLQELANEHATLRLMLQHPCEDAFRYKMRTLMNNVDRLTPASLARVIDLVTRE